MIESIGHEDLERFKEHDDGSGHASPTYGWVSRFEDGIAFDINLAD